MYRQIVRLTPVVKTRICPAYRSIWNWGVPSVQKWDPVPDVRSMMRQMERQMERFDREFENIFRQLPSISSPCGIAASRPLALPVHSVEDNNYKLNFDLSGFRPEDVKVSLKDNILTIHAKSEQKGDDGSRVYNEISRNYTLPEGMDTNAIKSIMSADGILTIEGPLPESEKPREIPIVKTESISAPQDGKDK